MRVQCTMSTVLIETHFHASKSPKCHQQYTPNVTKQFRRLPLLSYT